AYSLQSRNVKDSIAIPASQVDQRLTVGKLNKQFDGGISIAMPAMSESKPTTPQTNSVQSKQVLREASNQMDHSQEAIADEIRKNKLKAEAQEEEIDRASY
ncbi:MAG: hypothetical protein HRT61_11275, partial [Ekhidna sp.]|nr:hypothetical protein [Ekhidna sp.]